MREETKGRLDAAIKKLGDTATYEQIRQETGCAPKTISRYMKERKGVVPIPQREVPKSKPREDDGIYFFGLIDRKEGKPDGQITSQRPAWMHAVMLDDLKEELAESEQNLKRKPWMYEGEAKYKEAERNKARRAKIEAIESSRPELSGAQRDQVWKVYKGMRDIIRGDLFTTSEMKLGTASPHEEASRMSEYRIPVKSVDGLTPALARELRLRVEDGKTTRTDLEQAIKYIGGALHEETSSEAFRQDRVTARTAGRR